MVRTLIIDDEPAMLKVVGKFLEREGHEITVSSDSGEALQRVRDDKYDLILTDLKMPGADGIEVVREAAATPHRPPVIVMTAFGSVTNAVDAMQAGAADYVTKPFQLDELLLHINRALEMNALRSEVVQLREEVGRRYEFSNILARSKAMREVLDLVKRVAPTRSTVLILGKSGTGKELIARALHFNSPRRNKPFIAVNCGSIPETLLESELFGHTKGAFTGAVRDEPGLFLEATEGTLFLDEIGDVSPGLQVRLLRALQNQEIRPVGSSKTLKVDVRIIAATNQNLEDRIAEGKFREDLYYRLSVIPIHLPELKDRQEDVPLLARHFLETAARESGKQVVGFADETFLYLTRYAWPGNVRELENVIERAVLLTTHSHILPEDLPPHIRNSTDNTPIGSLPSGVTLEDLERAYISKVLEETGGQKKKTAEILGIDRRTLYRKLREYGELGSEVMED